MYGGMHMALRWSANGGGFRAINMMLLRSISVDCSTIAPLTA